MGFGAKVTVQTTRDYKVSGCIGPVTSMGQKGPQVGEVEIGIGGTSAWAISALTQQTTLAFYFEIANTEQMADGRQMHFQLCTTYQRPDGQMRMRVTTQAFNQTDT